jgi:hypothetical protein
MALAERVYRAVYAGEDAPLLVAQALPDEAQDLDDKLEWGLMVGLAYAIAVQEEPFGKRQRRARTRGCNGCVLSRAPRVERKRGGVNG